MGRELAVRGGEGGVNSGFFQASRVSRESVGKMSEDQFNPLSQRATGVESPYNYQHDLAMVSETDPLLLGVPTGLGKSAAAVLAWPWRRRFAANSVRNRTPRRLVYSLTIRVFARLAFGEAMKGLAIHVRSRGLCLARIGSIS
jgi:hypothetical protein